MLIALLQQVRMYSADADGFANLTDSTVMLSDGAEICVELSAPQAVTTSTSTTALHKPRSLCSQFFKSKCNSNTVRAKLEAVADNQLSIVCHKIDKTTADCNLQALISAKSLELKELEIEEQRLANVHSANMRELETKQKSAEENFLKEKREIELKLLKAQCAREELELEVKKIKYSEFVHGREN